MNRELNISQSELVGAWQERLPEVLNVGDQAQVMADGADEQAIRIHIATAGHQMYSFDFKCAYVDSREVNVQLVDVERDGQSTDERTEPIQELAHDYTRHIHECAQSLQSRTRP
ncbi:hypothetical protein [Paenibacillus tundrae]|uniref:Uncharacterized protein n=1 Tax=Paenibacillus tundrae TaxID=528187 RepID=A0ABT9WLU0_9BACL|nr:hypothetical protein [Paenibacillus tundrae]MDQ0174049.1 hypothetical protein [Paenibacillus tundrae]